MRKPTVTEGSSLLIEADCFTRARPFSGIIAQISHIRVHVWFDLAQLFRTFRSKEIWLDVFTILLNNATWCCVSQTERDLIAAEIEIAGGTWTRAEEANKVDRRRYYNEGRVHERFQSRCSVTHW